MSTRYLVVAALAALVVASTAGLAQSQEIDPVVTEIAPGDADVNRAGENVRVTLVYNDADGDTQIDFQPDETVYLALDRPQRVSFGDIRLTSFLTYPSGTAVNYTNDDVDFATREVNGGFAQDDEGSWYVDGDRDRSVSVGDLKLNPGESVEKIRPNDPRIGTSIERVQSDVPPSQRMIFFDQGPPGLDWRDTLVLDLDQNGQGNVGELRFHASRLGIDDSPTGREFQAAVDRLETSDEQLRTELVGNDQEMESRIDSLETQLATARDDLETKDDWLLALGLVDLLAVAGIGYWIYREEPTEGE